MKTLPLLDLQPWFGGSLKERQKSALALRMACEEWGFFGIQNHRVSTSSVEATFAQAKRFFAMDLCEKMKVYYQQTGLHRGYVPVGAARTLAET